LVSAPTGAGKTWIAEQAIGFAVSSLTGGLPFSGFLAAEAIKKLEASGNAGAEETARKLSTAIALTQGQNLPDPPYITTQVAPPLIIPGTKQTYNLEFGRLYFGPNDITLAGRFTLPGCILAAQNKSKSLFVPGFSWERMTGTCQISNGGRQTKESSGRWVSGTKG